MHKAGEVHSGDPRSQYSKTPEGTWVDNYTIGATIKWGEVKFKKSVEKFKYKKGDTECFEMERLYHIKEKEGTYIFMGLYFRRILKIETDDLVYYNRPIEHRIRDIFNRNSEYINLASWLSNAPKFEGRWLLNEKIIQVTDTLDYNILKYTDSNGNSIIHPGFYKFSDEPYHLDTVYFNQRKRTVYTCKGDAVKIVEIADLMTVDQYRKTH